MTKIILDDLTSIQNDPTAVDTINDNSAIIENAFDNTLSRDGTSPNQMLSNLDMNSHKILNLPAPRSPLEPARLKDIATQGTGVGLPSGGTTGQALTKTSNTDWNVDWTNVVNSFEGRTGNVVSQTGDYTKAEVGLGNVDNTSDLNKPISTATQTALNGKQPLDATLTTLSGKATTGSGNIVLATSPAITTPTGIVKGDVGLGNVDNTSDANKPVSTATQTALNGKQPLDATLTTLSGKSTTGTGNIVLATSPTLVTPALGTPTSGVATNLTGTASGLTAGNVTTNANLTGPITSVGNATSIASQTGTGTTFAMSVSPTFTGTPISTTASVDNNTTQIATTAYVVGQAASATPLVSAGSGAIGTSLRYARADHVHPGREVLFANRNYYVRTDGNDSNTGLVNSSGGAFLTVQRGIDVITGTLDLNGFNVTLNVIAGTYTANNTISGSPVGKGTFLITGDTTTPSNCFINTNGHCFYVGNSTTVVSIRGFKLASAAGSCLVADLGAYINITNNMEFGAASTGYHIQADQRATITGFSNYSITGSASSHWRANLTGQVRYQAATITLTGTPAFNGGFCSADILSSAYVNGNTFSGSATGPRYSVNANSVIFTNGGGASYFPGNSVGSAAAGGQYI